MQQTIEPFEQKPRRQLAPRVVSHDLTRQLLSPIQDGR